MAYGNTVNFASTSTTTAADKIARYEPDPETPGDRMSRHGTSLRAPQSRPAIGVSYEDPASAKAVCFTGGGGPRRVRVDVDHRLRQRGRSQGGSFQPDAAHRGYRRS